MPMTSVSGSSCLRMCISVNADLPGNRICSLPLDRVSLIELRHMGFQTAFLLLRNRCAGCAAGFAVILGEAAAGVTITASF